MCSEKGEKGVFCEKRLTPQEKATIIDAEIGKRPIRMPD